MSTEKKPAKKRRKKWPFILLSIVGLLLALAAFLPNLLSTSFIRNQVLTRVNDKVDGQVKIENWSLSWKGPNRFDGIQYHDGQGVQIADVKSATIFKGLWSLIQDQENLGEITIHGPVVNYTLPESSSAVDKKPPAKPEATRKQPIDIETGRPKIPLPHVVEPPSLPVSLTLKISEGSVNLTAPNTEQPLNISGLQVNMVVDKDKPQVVLHASGKFGAELAPLVAEVTAHPAVGSTFEPENITLNGKVETTALRLEPLLAVGAAFNQAVPQGAGLLNANIEFVATGPEAVNAGGSISTENVQLRGGALGKDAPNIGNLDLHFVANRSAMGFSVKDTKITSRFVNATILGDIKNGDVGKVNFDGEVDLAAVAKEFPHALKLQEGLSLSSGKIKAAAELKQTSKLKTLGTTIVISDVAGEVDNKPVQLNKPIELQFAGAIQGEKDLHVQKLDVQSSFLQAQGKGSMDNLSIDVQASLEKALAEVQQFVDIGDWQAKGDATLAATVVKQNEKERKLTLTFDSAAFELKQGEKEYLPEQPVNIAVDALADIPEQGFLTQIFRLESSFQTGLARGKVNLFNLVLPERVADAAKDAPAALPTLETISLNTAINLEALSHLLPPPTNGPPMKLLGNATIAGAGSVTKEEINTRVMSFVFSDLYYEQGPKALFQRSASLQTQMRIRPDKKQVELNDVLAKFSAGEIVADHVVLNNWEDVLQSLDAMVSGKFNLLQVSKDLQKWTGSPEPVPMGGHAQLTVIAKPPKGGAEASLHIDSTLTDFAWKLKNEAVITDSNVQFKVNAAFSDEMNNLNLSGLELSSTPVSVKADVAMKNLKSATNSNPSMVTAQGSIRYDMEKIDPYIKLLSGQELKATGRVEKPFSLRMPLSEASDVEGLAGTFFESAFYAESMRLYGLDIRKLEIPVLLENDLLQASLEAVVNRGKLALYPSIDLSLDEPILSIPTNSVVLDNVDLSDGLADELLGAIHPVFKGASVATGKVSVVMDYLEVPTAGDVTQKLRFAGTIQLRDVKLESSGLIGIILQLTKVKERSYMLEHEDIRFSCENGRIKTSPLKIKLSDDYPLTFDGTLGIDQTIDYGVSVPVTDKILDQRYARYLEGESVRLPIGGTASKPRISSNALQDALKPLISKGAKKAAGELLNEKAGELLEGLFK